MPKNINKTKAIEAIGEPKVSHDSFFKYFFSYQELAQELLMLVLPREIYQLLDLEQLRFERDSFIGNRADLIFSVPFRVDVPDPPRVFFIIEHKSYYTRALYTQMLKYQNEALLQMSLPGISSPPVVLMAFYHGHRNSAEWKRSLMENYFSANNAWPYMPEIFKRTISNPDIILIDPRDPQVMRCLAEHDFLSRGVIMLLDRVSHTYKLPVQEAAAIIIDDFASLREVQTKFQIDESIWYIRRYLMCSGNYQEKDWQEVAIILAKAGIVIMDIRKYYTGIGRQEGRQEGLREGLQRALQQIAVNMLKKKVDIAFIAEVTGLPKHKVQQIKRRNGTKNSH